MTATAIRERPILFSAAMVRAILSGRKTQTRRVVTGAVWDLDDSEQRRRLTTRPGDGHDAARVREHFRNPYGEPGDHLWVRETWADLRGGGFDKPVAYFADNTRAAYSGGPLVEDGDAKRARLDYGVRWTPSIHMPRWAARITLEVTDLRVERLQAITEDDAKAEGVSQHDPIEFADLVKDGGFLNFRERFRRLWDSINAKRGYGWDVNPWVWVIGFRRFPSVSNQA